jgi:plasmid stabilization system protein ParE
MKVEFLEPAAQEFYEASAFYNIQRQGLGQEFAKEVEDTIERMKQNPEAWATVYPSKRARRCLTNRFPYGVIYQIRQDTLLIVAIWHQRRRPQTWQERLSKIKQ